MEIAKNFQSLKTEWGRLWFVGEIERAAMPFSDAFRQPGNVWPNGIRPQTPELASTKLAQLDARWLELD